MISLEEHLTLACGVASELFMMNGHLTPMIHYIDSNDKHFVVGVPAVGGDDEEKDAIARTIRRNFKRFKVVQYVLISEAWTAVIPEGEYDGQRAADHPDRVEVLQLMAENKQRQISARVKITRDDNGWTLGEAEVSTEPVIGRMCGFLETPQ